MGKIQDEEITIVEDKSPLARIGGKICR